MALLSLFLPASIVHMAVTLVAGAITQRRRHFHYSLRILLYCAPSRKCQLTYDRDMATQLATVSCSSLRTLASLCFDIVIGCAPGYGGAPYTENQHKTGQPSSCPPPDWLGKQPPAGLPCTQVIFFKTKHTDHTTSSKAHALRVCSSADSECRAPEFCCGDISHVSGSSRPCEGRLCCLCYTEHELPSVLLCRLFTRPYDRGPTSWPLAGTCRRRAQRAQRPAQRAERGWARCPAVAAPAAAAPPPRCRAAPGSHCLTHVVARLINNKARWAHVHIINHL